jgi:uncharacterized protein YndB with AHSA1/START domain
MSRVSASLELPYPAERVFEVATRIDDLPRWLPEVTVASLLDTPLALGSRVRLKLSSAAAGAEVTGTVRQLRPPSMLVIAGAGGPLAVEVRTRLDPVGDDGLSTRIALEIDLTTSPLLGFIAREAERRINAELPAALDRFRHLVEEAST